MVMNFLNNNSNAIGAGSSIMSGISGLFGKNSSAKALKAQYDYGMKMQKDAQQFNERMYRNRYQYQREDMEAAGINPLYGFGNPSSTTSGMGSVGMPDYVGEKKNRIDQALQGIQLGQQFSAQKAATNKIQQETETEKINTEIKKLEKIGAQIDNLSKQKDLDWKDKTNLANLKKTYSDIEKNISGMTKDYADAGQARAGTAKIKSENEKINRMNKFYKQHPIIGGIVQGYEDNGGGIPAFIKNTTGANDQIKKFENLFYGTDWRKQYNTKTKDKGRAYSAAVKARLKRMN